MQDTETGAIGFGAGAITGLRTGAVGLRPGLLPHTGILHNSQRVFGSIV